MTKKMVAMEAKDEMYVEAIVGGVLSELFCCRDDKKCDKKELVRRYKDFLYGEQESEEFLLYLRRACRRNIVRKALKKGDDLDVKMANADYVEAIVATATKELSLDAVRACDNCWVRKNEVLFEKDTEKYYAYMPFYLIGTDEISKIIDVVINVLRPLDLWVGDYYTGDGVAVFNHIYTAESRSWAVAKGILDNKDAPRPVTESERQRRFKKLFKYLKEGEHVNMSPRIRDVLHNSDDVAYAAAKQCAERVVWIGRVLEK